MQLKRSASVVIDSAMYLLTISLPETYSFCLYVCSDAYMHACVHCFAEGAAGGYKELTDDL